MRKRHRWMRKDEALSSLICEADMPEARRRVLRQAALAGVNNPRGKKRTSAGVKIIKNAMAKERRQHMVMMKRQARRDAEEAQWPSRLRVPTRLAGTADGARDLVKELLPSYGFLTIAEGI